MVESGPKVVIKRNGAEAPYDKTRIATAIYRAASSLGGKDLALAHSLADEVHLQVLANFGQLRVPTVEDIQDLVEEVLIRRGHAKTAKAYILYRYQRAQVRKGRTWTGSRVKTDTKPWRLMWNALSWNIDHGCESIEALNELTTSGRLPQLIKAGDAYFEEQLDWLLEELLDRTSVRAVIMAGPSSSGKTTSTHKLALRMKAAGLKPVLLGLDNYFRDLELHPKDEYGDYDYETPEALDIPLINQHLAQLLAGEEVLMPRYDFHTGRQLLNQIPLRIEPDQVLLIDTLHGLYEPLTAVIPSDRKFRIYIETFSQIRPRGGRFIRWTDIRLLRRIVRDSKFRNHTPSLTLGHWHYVRRAEMKHIIPALSNVDYALNGAVPYELPMLKRHVWDMLPDLVKEYQSQEGRQDAALRARRLHDLLEKVVAASDEDEAAIPGDSLLREFIGGSVLL